jgi:hypothetical protein
VIERKSHIIHQQKLEVQFESNMDYFSIQNEIQELYYEQLLPAIEALFDETAGDKTSIVIERLEIDCGILNSNGWKKALVEKALREIKVQLNQHPGKEADNDRFAINDFLYFLENGRLLWNSRIQSVRELEQAINERQLDSTETKRLETLLKTNSAAAERLIYNFSEPFIQNLLRKIAEVEKALWEIFDELIEGKGLTERQRQMAQVILLKLLAENKQVNEILMHELLNDIKKNNSLPNPIKKVAEVEDVYIHNAGLVIVHPFLPGLFAELGLWVNKEWKDETAQHTAVRILEYLSSGNYEEEEFNLLFNKIMCGMPLTIALQPAEELPATIRSECDDLLRQVVQHWSKIGNTSIAGLREAFLQRDGRLQQVEDGWKLHVELSGLDILLESLPWGFGIVALPWTKDKIYVEWI